MQDKKQFPLISGNLSLDLVNTELVRRGQRYDLLITNEDVLEWLHVIKVNLPFWNEKTFISIQERTNQVTSSILEVREVLRKQFEAIANQQEISNDFITYLEKQIEKAPFTYKIIEQQLVSIPVGEIEDVLASLIAFDALTLIAENKLIFLKRCSNPDCVLLFIDKSGKRKWCSMKICGNRKKVAKFQDRKFEEV
ncbi:RNA-binding protein [Bacillus cereus]|uniref:CGNR zinc finger domain-containing protein n=1 Tax=Bacillus cereus TaxID=1396 RepID=UPI0007B6A07F|nr:CGNR zinc finger domain-containing protein [Bacillus cereus]MRC32098.1 RNA-binding protein [Bacillus thuringiensis]ANC18098.1 RNA-binding protein [Bacillus cereus]MDA2478106.1 CGNR zinc finger domain-containing protein [Bacillus cereus]MDA2495267.1 CGNR zinc finger domain-containing protein [Bacillus cereus]HDR8039811.1 CGNR zinc finger domain-containing protein [Bacillus cereus]